MKATKIIQKTFRPDGAIEQRVTVVKPQVPKTSAQLRASACFDAVRAAAAAASELSAKAAARKRQRERQRANKLRGLEERLQKDAAENDASSRRRMRPLWSITKFLRQTG
jgi:hypothetical protein